MCLNLATHHVSIVIMSLIGLYLRIFKIVASSPPTSLDVPFTRYICLQQYPHS